MCPRPSKALRVLNSKQDMGTSLRLFVRLALVHFVSDPYMLNIVCVLFRNVP